MAEHGSYRFYEKVLAFLRTRLLGAVMMPALIGAALAARGGAFHWLRFVLILVGLAAAELLNLLGSDYQMFRNPGKQGSQLPGNPVFSTERLPASRIPLLLAPIALIGLGVLIYFTVTVGIGVLLFLLAAGIIGALYVYSPFRYAFLYTAFIPPLISGGVYLALTGKLEGLAFAAGVPITLISLGVIVGYRVMYEREGLKRRRSRAVVLALFCLAGINVLLYVPAGIFPWIGLAAVIPLFFFTWMIGTVSVRERKDSVPATALGVMMHTSTCLIVAAALLFG
ncbi:MAG: hypothetical protein JSV89_20380 [Spirochaetaceae bacterium]|nr:MAG: hypothetical protein JSV89_20380 [Spirochaetaceae bacterium]